MRINDYLQLRNVTVTTGNPGINSPQTASGDSDFAKELRTQLSESENVEFSKHAAERMYERGIDLSTGDTLERLNKAVKLADEKGSGEALVMIDANAFIVSVKNNKVITALSSDDMKNNIFTGIDSTVIM